MHDGLSEPARLAAFARADALTGRKPRFLANPSYRAAYQQATAPDLIGTLIRVHVVHVRDVPPAVEKAVIRAARKQDVAVNELVCGLLAAKLAVAHEPRESGFADGFSRQSLRLRMTPVLHRAARVWAADHDATIRGLVLSTLAEAYGLPVVSLSRRPRTVA